MWIIKCFLGLPLLSGCPRPLMVATSRNLEKEIYRAAMATGTIDRADGRPLARRQAIAALRQEGRDSRAEAQRVDLGRYLDM
eukprot:670215-Pyramimonas_sp.AAC.1